jgi:hypothetical protein
MSGPIGHVGSATAGPENKNDHTQTAGWADFARLIDPAKMPNPFRPEDKMMQEFSRYAETVGGRNVVAWLRSITDLAPYPNVSGGNFEQVAIAAAKHDARATIGRMIAAAITEGTAIRNQNKG